MIFPLLAAWLLGMLSMAEAAEEGKPRAAAAKPGKETAKEGGHPSREFLHFGNMGGLLPTLEMDDLKEPDTQAAQWIFKYCGQCHNVPGPGLHTDKEWGVLFWRMYWRMVVMEQHFPNVQLPKYGEAEMMLAYLRKHSLKTLPTNEIDLTKPGANEFVRICGQCHGHPDPAAYPDHDWAFTIKRMKRHMKSMNKEIPDDKVAQKIEHFVAQQSKVIR